MFVYLLIFCTPRHHRKCTLLLKLVHTYRFHTYEVKDVYFLKNFLDLKSMTVNAIVKLSDLQHAVHYFFT